MQQRIEHLRSDMRLARQNAVRYGSRMYEDQADDAWLEEQEALNIVIELASGGSSDTEHKIERRAEHSAREFFEREAEQLAAVTQRLEEYLDTLDRRIAQRRQEDDAHRRHNRTGSPGPVGVGAH